MCSSGSELRPNEYEILYHLARVGEDYQSSIAKAIKGKKSARKSLNKYYRYLEDEGLIRVSKEEAVKKYYKITHDGFQHLLEKWPLETVINSTERVLEEADSNFEKSVDIEGIRFHFIVDGCFGIRIENGFGKPDVPENPISADSDYVYKYLQPIRDTKLDGQLILNKLRENSLDTLDEILLVYTGYEPQEIEDDYYKILEKVRTEESTVEIAGQENLPILQEPHLYEGAIENTIEMIENSPSNVKFFFTKSQGLDELEGKIKEFLDITNG